MIPALPGPIPPRDGDSRGGPGWGTSAIIHALFAAAVFAVQGSAPPLGPDHLSYLQLADSIIAACPSGDYWRETSSIRFYGVLLAYLHGWTGSHILSMKLVLAAFSTLYLLASQLFFSLFTPFRRQALLFALLSGFAVSFGFASWGVTDSTALLPRTLVAPIVMLSMWFWFRFDGRPLKYLAFVFLVPGSLMHLGTFHVIGVLVLLEVWDLVILRRMRVDRLLAAFVGGLLMAVAALVALEYAGVASKSLSQHLPDMLRAVGLEVTNIGPVETGGLTGCSALSPSTAAKPVEARVSSKTGPAPAPAQPAGRAAGTTGSGQAPVTAKQAWAAELAMRPWRNMPLPLANVANAFSSSLLILLLAAAGMGSARRSGFSRYDHLMTAMFFVVPFFAFVPQTLLWILRSFASIYPATIEEVRALGLIMIPALYFVLRLFRLVVESGRPSAPLAGAAVVVAFLALPLFMKNLPQWARESILSAMISMRIVDPQSEAHVANARATLGIAPGSSALYYATLPVRRWLAANTPPGTRILTDRDDLVLLPDRVILGPRQVAVNAYHGTPAEAALFLRTAQAMAARDIGRLMGIAADYGAEFVVVGWRAPGAAYADEAFSVIPVPARRRP